MELSFQQNLPRHVGIIMDGNGRWAQQRSKPRMWGHRAGSKTVRKITEECANLGISQLTLYAFSYENWKRPKTEVDYLMLLLRRFLSKEKKTIMDNNIRLASVGRTGLLPTRVQDKLNEVKKMSAKNTGMTLCLALSYGGRVEIVDMVKSIARKVVTGDVGLDAIDENLCSQNMYQPDMPDLDLVIRTGGDMRLSNFLLWQFSYSELWVTSTLWPDFQEQDLHRAFTDFAYRERRFGKVPTAAQLVGVV